MGNIILGVRDATRYCTFDSNIGNWNAGWPVDNASKLPLSKVARSIEPSYVSTKIGWTCTTDQQAGLFGLIRHNAPNALIRFYLYSDDEYGVLVKDSNWMAMSPPVYEVYDDQFARDGFFAGTYSPDQLQNKVLHRLWWAGENVVHKSGLCIIHDPDNADGYVEAGLLKIEYGMQFSHNFRYGAQRGYRNRDEKIEAKGGAIYTERNTGKRIFKGEIPFLTESQAEILDEMKENYGSTDPFLFMENPEDARRTRAFLARFSDTEPHSLAAFARNTCPISLEEVIES